MKKLLLSSALAAGLGLPAAAQTQPEPRFLAAEAGPVVAASDLIGARLHAAPAGIAAAATDGLPPDWEDIGEVSDILISREAGVAAVLVDIGGFLGIGERQVAVELSALRIVEDAATEADDWFVVLQADRALLEGAPEWTAPEWPAAAATADAAGPADAGMAGATAAEPPADTAGAGAIADPVLREGYAAVQPGSLTAEMLKGAPLRDLAEDEIGSVADLVLAEDGSVTHVLVDIGGFLGIGSRRVALAIGEIEILRAADGSDLRLYVPMSREELEALPEAAL